MNERHHFQLNFNCISAVLTQLSWNKESFQYWKQNSVMVNFSPGFLENDHTHKPTQYFSVNHIHNANF